MDATEKALWMELWVLDYQMNQMFPNGFGKDYFQGLVADNTITKDDYKKITGEDYTPAGN